MAEWGFVLWRISGSREIECILHGSLGNKLGYVLSIVRQK